MPPALSDAESSDDEIPATRVTTGGNKAAEPVADVEEDNDDDDGEEDVGEDEFIVEKILGHRFNRGTLEFDVKWQGYEDLRDRTWEPEDNMQTAADVLKEYFDEIGGRPEKPAKGTKRKSAATKSETGTPASSSKRSKKAPPPAEQAWSPPPGSWEHDVSHIDTVEQSIDPKTGREAKFGYIVWNNQKKTQHPLKHIYTKCPQKMLQYYESHLVFTTSDEPGQNGQNGNAMDEAF